MHKEDVTIKKYTYTVVFKPAEEGGYIVTCPTLPGVVTEGDTLGEARIMARDAIHGYLETLQKHGLPIPIEERPVQLARGSTLKQEPVTVPFAIQ